MRFDFTDLSLFVSAVETGSLTRGAERVGLALAAASARIRLMEERLHVRLLDRSSRGVRPTPAGETLLRHARILLADVQVLDAEIADFAGGLRGRVRLLSNTNALAEFLPRALGRFLALHADISVAVEERLSHEIVRAVGAGEAEIGIIAGTTEVAELQSFPFARDRLVLVVPVASSIVTEALPLADVLDHPFVGIQEASAIQTYVGGIAARAGRRLRLRMQLLSFDGVCRMVEEGAGLAIVPESAALRYASTMAIRIVQLSDDWALRDLRLCVLDKARLTPIGRLLLDHLCQNGND